MLKNQPKQINENAYYDEFGFLNVKAILAHEGDLEYRCDDGSSYTAFMSAATLAEGFNQSLGAVLTKEHPQTGTGEYCLVDQDNFKSVAVGYLGKDVKVEGKDVIGTLIIADKEAQQAVLAGEKKGVSLGYTNYLLPQFDSTADNEKFDIKQLKLNHLSLVESPRAERAVFSFDSRQKSMSDYNKDEREIATISLDSSYFSSNTLKMIDQTMAEQIKQDNTEKLLELNTELNKLRTAFDSQAVALSSLESTKTELEAKIKTLEDTYAAEKKAWEAVQASLPTQDQTEAEVAARVEAWKTYGEGITFDSKLSATDILRSKLISEFPDQAETLKTASSEYLTAYRAAFDSFNATLTKKSNSKTPSTDLFTNKSLAASFDSKQANQESRSNSFVRNEDGSRSPFNFANR